MARSADVSDALFETRYSLVTRTGFLRSYAMSSVPVTSIIFCMRLLNINALTKQAQTVTVLGKPCHQQGTTYREQASLAEQCSCFTKTNSDSTEHMA